MKILTDLHHGDLYYALHCLFEKRLDFELYCVIGHEWADDYWKIHETQNDRSVVGQYLSIDVSENAYHDFNIIKDDIYYIWDKRHFYYRKHIRLDTFKDIKFDIILPSHYNHYASWKLLQQRYQPDAKLICHVGNVDRHDNVDYVIRSVPFLGTCKRSVIANQEIDKQFYSYVPVNRDATNITSITSGGFFKDLYYKYSQLLPEYNFKYYGVDSPDGPCNGLQDISKKMQEANLGWTTKPWGSLGHTNMGWLYSGRPVITNMSEHRRTGELALELFEPGVTCIDLDSGTEKENCDIIKKWIDPDVSTRYGIKAMRRFHEVVNYEIEANNVKSFLSDII